MKDIERRKYEDLAARLLSQAPIPNRTEVSEALSELLKQVDATESRSASTATTDTMLGIAITALNFYATDTNWRDTPSWDGDPDCYTPKAIPMIAGTGQCDQGEIAKAALREIGETLTAHALQYAATDTGLCEDEGCEHHGTPHICVNKAITPERAGELVVAYSGASGEVTPAPGAPEAGRQATATPTADAFLKALFHEVASNDWYRAVEQWLYADREAAVFGTSLAAGEKSA